MFIKCYQVDCTGRKAIGYNLDKMNQETTTDCWINVNTGMVLRVDYTDLSKNKIKERSMFNISNSQGDIGYSRAVIISPTIEKEISEILEEKEVKKLGRPFKKV